MNIEESDIPASIEKAREYIMHIHLADSTRLQPGYGHIGFKEGFSTLKKIGYKNYMVLECIIKGESKFELPKVVKYLKKCME